MATKAVIEARARVKEAEVALARLHADKAAAEKRAKPLAATQERARKAAARTELLIARPGERIMLTNLSGVRSSHWIDEAVRVAVKEAGRNGSAKATELFETGVAKINLPGEGTALTIKGLAPRTRITDKAALRRIAAARHRLTLAENAASKARSDLAMVTKGAYATGTKIDAATLAAFAGTDLALTIAIRAASTIAPTYAFGEAERTIEAARRHLEHAESKSKDPCPCSPCMTAANQAHWAAENAKRQAEREAKAEAEAKAIAKMPKVSFTCPACGCDSVSPVWPGTGEVECQSELCGSTAIADAIKTKRVPKSTPVGLVRVPGEEEAA